MTVEIKELIIKAIVSDKSEDKLSDSPEPIEKNESIEKDELISACVDQVLKILERSKER